MSLLATPSRRAHGVRMLEQQVLREDAEYQRYGNHTRRDSPEQTDFLLAGPEDPHAPGGVFERLRWGGLFYFVSPSADQTAEVAQTFGPKQGFAIECPPTVLRPRLWGMKLSWLAPFFPLLEPLHYFAARRVMLVQPGQVTDRFTYDVRLDRCQEPSSCVVRKQLPEYDYIFWRLRQKYPDAALDGLAQRTRKLVDKVFPVFLTREAAFLNILRRDLPDAYRCRVPEIVDSQRDERGFVRCLQMNWLRRGTRKLSQMDFALQSMDLLRVLHDQIGIIHLDLRLDNMVVSDRGVGFVDFGSAVRVGEDLSESPMLTVLFDEMMSTSSIQRVLGRMKRTSKVTSKVFLDVHQKVDKAVDVFYLTLQIAEPHSNPDFRDLVEYDPQSAAAQAIAELVDQVLRPSDPDHPPYQTAQDVLRGLEAVQKRL